MSLRIGFDLDGVLADMDAALVRQAEAVFGEQIVRGLEADAASPESESEPQASQAAPPDGADSNPTVTRLHMTSRQERTLWRHVATVENFWETLQETESGIVARLAKTAADRRWEIIFLTKRPKTVGAPAQIQSQRWLVSKGYPLPSVFVVRGSRGRIAASLDLDVVVDDRPENCLDVTIDSKARPILVWRDDEKALPAGARRLGIGVVRSVGDCLEILTTLDEHNSQKDPSLLARVKKMLGLKTQAGA
jgi:hypothetical protein